MTVAKAGMKRAARKAAPGTGRRGAVPHYRQTTDFSCGSSSLPMAMKALDPGIDFMGLPQQADLAEMNRLKIAHRIGARGVAGLRRDLAEGAVPVVLVGTDYIRQGPTAHRGVVTGIDDENVTINGPWIPKDKGHGSHIVTDYVVPRRELPAMAADGPRKERATVPVRRR